ncbi:MAG: cytochrome c3 family protein [Planctomycetota bacterium]|jgi:hypothetical protein
MKPYLTIAVGLILIVAASCLQSTTSLSLRGSQDMPNNNGLCLVCHLDFDEDPITADHLQRGITCAHCHGKSVAHMHDETMMTSPDVLYGRTEVESMCRHCHRSHKDKREVENFRAKWLGKKRENGRNITAESTCTDCHGLHTISRR